MQRAARGWALVEFAGRTLLLRSTLARLALPLGALLVSWAWISPSLQHLGLSDSARVQDFLLPGIVSVTGSLLMVALLLRLQRAEHALRVQLERQNTLNGIYQGIASGLPLSVLLARIVSGIERENPQALASILLRDSATQTLHVGATSRLLPEIGRVCAAGVPIGEGFGSCGTAAFRREAVIAADIANDPLWVPYQSNAALDGIAACWSQPILATDGSVLGTFAIYHRRPCAPSSKALRQIEEIAALAAIAIERQRQHHALQLADTVFSNSSEAIIVTDTDNHIRAVNPAFTRLTGYTMADVVGHKPSVLASGRMPADFFSRMWESLKTQGRWEGEIWNRRKNGEVFAEYLKIEVARQADGSITNYVGMFSDLTEAKHAEELIWQQANYDQLTGLPNRRLFRDRLQQEMQHAKHHDRPLALLLIDLDGFTDINASLGQDFGDLLLVQTAQRIVQRLGDDDSAARLGSDEFTVILSGRSDPAGIERAVVNLLQSLNQPYLINGTSAFCSASVGISLYPDNGANDQELLKNADQALRAARLNGRGHFSWCTPELQHAAQVRAELIRDLHGALDGRQMQVHYQPIIDLNDGRITKVEALLRWQHPQHGWISPATFIPLAEEVGLISEIGDWVFRTVVDQACRLRAKGIHLKFGVNKSPKQFSSGDCANDWLDILAATGLPADYIIIEITEGLLLEKNASVATRLHAFRTAGVKIAIDDFGTGYSSLSYLQRFDIDYLKIDRSFIAELGNSENSRALTDAVIVMAHKLGIELIAEGVETASQRDWLHAAGCDFAQGFLYAQALPAHELEQLLSLQPAI